MSEYRLGDKVLVTGIVSPTYVDKDIPNKMGVSPNWEDIKALPSIPQHWGFSMQSADVRRVSVRVLEKVPMGETVGVIMGIRHLKEGIIRVITLGDEPNYLEQRNNVKVYLVSTNLYLKPIFCLPEQVDSLEED